MTRRHWAVPMAPPGLSATSPRYSGPRNSDSVLAKLAGRRRGQPADGRNAMIDIDRRTFSRLGVGAAFALSPLRVLAADAYPSRPIHLLVGFTPGSSSDITG